MERAKEEKQSQCFHGETRNMRTSLKRNRMLKGEEVEGK